MDRSKLISQIRMGMNLIDQDEFTTTIRAISQIAADTVKKTLGPYAHTTIIDDGNFTYATKDGWSILQRLRFQDPAHQSIFTLLKNISFRIVDKVGDGTTTAMVTADHFIDMMEKSGLASSKYRQVDIVNAINDVRDMIIGNLRANAISIGPEANDPNYDAIHDVAYISSNSNEKLACIMQDIYQKTGNPHMLIDMDGGTSISYEIQEGYRFDCSFIRHERYANTSEHYYDTMGNPHMVFIFDHNVTYQKHARMIHYLMDMSYRKEAFCILMAPYFDDVMSAQFDIMFKQHYQKNPNAAPSFLIIQIPEASRASIRQDMNDFASLAGSPVISATKVKIFNELTHNEQASDPKDIIHDDAMKLDEFNFSTAQELIESCGGIIYDAVIGKNFFTLKNFNRESTLYREKYAEAKKEFEEAKAEVATSVTTYTKRFMEATRRLNKLSGSLGVIHVGGISELERQCTKDVVDDTVLACRSAYENGVCAGLNLGVLCAIDWVIANIQANDGWKMNDPKCALQLEVAKVLRNAYVETTKDIMRNKDKTKSDDDMEYLINALITDLNAGNISSFDLVTGRADCSRIPKVSNSVATDVEILYGVTSILGMILTSDQYLSINRHYDKTAASHYQEQLNREATIQKVTDILETVKKIAPDLFNGFSQASTTQKLPGMILDGYMTNETSHDTENTASPFNTHE